MTQIRYDHQLLDHRWATLQKAILHRDDFRCTVCGADEYLHVHHRRYIRGRMAWEYDAQDLITLCRVCHDHAHESPIPVLDERGQQITTVEVFQYLCQRCEGVGVIPWFSHVEDGICFLCHGAGYNSFPSYNPFGDSNTEASTPTFFAPSVRGDLNRREPLRARVLRVISRVVTSKRSVTRRMPQRGDVGIVLGARPHGEILRVLVECLDDRGEIAWRCEFDDNDIELLLSRSPAGSSCPDEVR